MQYYPNIERLNIKIISRSLNFQDNFTDLNLKKFTTTYCVTLS